MVLALRACLPTGDILPPCLLGSPPTTRVSPAQSHWVNVRTIQRSNGGPIISRELSSRVTQSLAMLLPYQLSFPTDDEFSLGMTVDFRSALVRRFGCPGPLCIPLCRGREALAKPVDAPTSLGYASAAMVLRQWAKHNSRTTRHPLEQREASTLS